MIELPPPRKLRELVAEICLRDSHEVHQYGARSGAAVYLDAVHQFLAQMYDVKVTENSIYCSAVLIMTLICKHA